MSHVRRDNFSDINNALLSRFDMGECDAGEEVSVNELLSSAQEEQLFREMLSELAGMDVDEPSALEQRKALIALQARLSSIDTGYASQVRGVTNQTAGLRRRTPKSSWSTVLGMALGAMLLVSGWYGAMSYLNIGSAGDVSVYSTENGQRSTVTLSDGSVVVLNVGSRLEVPVNYADGNRALRLSGEALFTVVNHDRSPFTVTAGSSTTRVLGTSFIVRKYPSDTAATIAVRDGKVMVQSTVLTAMQQVEVNGLGTSAVYPTSTAQFSFVFGVLMFNGVLLPDAVPQLNRWYDVDIRLGDSSLLKREVVGGFKEGSLTDLSSILELMLNVEIVRSGRTLTLYPRR